MKKRIVRICVILALGLMAFGGYTLLRPDAPEVSGYCMKTEAKEGEIWCVEVAGMKNKVLQDKMNQAIQTDWILWLKDYLESPLELGVYLDGYFISDQYLCITGGFDSYGTRGGGKKYYCAVYNLKNGERVYLDDLFELSDEFIQALKQYGRTWQCDLGEIMVRIPGFENSSEEAIRNGLEKTVMSQSDYNDMIKGTDGKSYFKPDFIISENSLYIDVKIPLEKLEDFLKVPKWWKSKPGLKNADLEMVNNEIKEYLDMTNQEIKDLTGKELDSYADTFVFKTKVMYPCIRPSDLPFYFICRDWESPGYLAFYEESEQEYMDLLGISRDMGFEEIIAAMGIEQVLRESTEYVNDYDRERHKIELEKYGLRYIFCSDYADGHDFSMFIGKKPEGIAVSPPASPVLP